MKKMMRIAILVLVMACLLLQVVCAYEPAEDTLDPDRDIGGTGNATPSGEEADAGHGFWIPKALEDEEMDKVDDALEKEDADAVEDAEEEVYVSPSTGVGTVAVIACVSAAGLAVTALTKKKEQ